MGILKIKNYVKDCSEYLPNLTRYIIKRDPNTVMYGSPNTNLSTPEAAIKQINQVKSFFKKEEFNCMIHIIISFDCSEVSDEFTAVEYTRRICTYFSDRYQLIWSVHNETRYNRKGNTCSEFHTHIAINPVSYIDGHMLNMNYSAQHVFLNYLKTVTETQDKYWIIDRCNDKSSISIL